MKELHKRLLALGMGAVMIFAMGAAGCNSGNQGQTPQTPSTGTTTPDPDKDKEPDDSPLPEMKTLEDAKTEFDAFVDRLATGKNFTYVLKSASQNVTTQFAGNKAKSDRNGEVYYLTEENGENFVIGLEDDNAWHKNFAEENMSIDYALSTVTNALEGITWTAYDENSNLLSGEVSTMVEGLEVKAKIEANFDQNDMSVKMNNGLLRTNMAISKVGTTAVTLPEKVIDETAKDKYIYTIDENGDYVWNRKLIAETIKKWWPEGYYKKIQRQDCELIDILAVEYEEGRLTFLTYFSGDSGKFFQKIGIPKAYFNAEELQTVSDFEKYLNNREYPVDSCEAWTKVEYSTLDADYEIARKQEFETLTKNVFERLATIGTQRNNLSDKGEIVKDFEGAKILFGFATPMSDLGLSSDMGYTKTWRQIYVCENNGKIELLNLWIMGKDSWDSWSLSATESVMQDKNNAWRILSLGRQDIAKENVDILGEPIMTIGKSLSKE